MAATAAAPAAAAPRFARPQNSESVPWQAHAEAVVAREARIAGPQLAQCFERFKSILKDGLGAGAPAPEVTPLRTFVRHLPQGREVGAGYSLCVERTQVRAQRVDFAPAAAGAAGGGGGGLAAGRSFVAEYATGPDGRARSLPDPAVTASDFIFAAFRALQQLAQSEGVAAGAGGAASPRSPRSPVAAAVEPLKIAVVSTYPLALRRLNCGEILHFRARCPVDFCEDSLEGADLANLLQVGLQRNGLAVRVVAVCSAATAGLLAGVFARPPRGNRCLLSYACDDSVRCAYVERKPEDLGADFSPVVDLDFAFFRGTYIREEESYRTVDLVPRSAADFQLDFRRAASPDLVEFERLDRVVAGQYFPELCRLLGVLALRERAPPAMYAPDSFSFAAALAVLGDDARTGLHATVEVGRRLWGAELAPDAAAALHGAVQAVFERSASVTAAIIGAVAVRTGRMQAALGGLAVALFGVVASDPRYQALVRRQLDQLFNRDTSEVLQFMTIEAADLKGAALLGWTVLNELN